jgi:hypothetical protein
VRQARRRAVVPESAEHGYCRRVSVIVRARAITASASSRSWDQGNAAVKVFTLMNEPNPAEPPPAIGQKGLVSSFVADGRIAPRAHITAPGEELTSTKPRKSFFRGVAVGIAIMIPIWAWVILRLMR